MDTLQPPGADDDGYATMDMMGSSGFYSSLSGHSNIGMPPRGSGLLQINIGLHALKCRLTDEVDRLDDLMELCCNERTVAQQQNLPLAKLSAIARAVPDLRIGSKGGLSPHGSPSQAPLEPDCEQLGRSSGTNSIGILKDSNHLNTNNSNNNSNLNGTGSQGTDGKRVVVSGCGLQTSSSNTFGQTISQASSGLGRHISTRSRGRSPTHSPVRSHPSSPELSPRLLEDEVNRIRSDNPLPREVEVTHNHSRRASFFSEGRGLTRRSMSMTSVSMGSESTSPSYILSREDREALHLARLQAELEDVKAGGDEDTSEVQQKVSWGEKFVTSNKFEMSVAFAVLANAVLIGVDVEYAARAGGESPMVFYFMQHTFTLFFAFELLLRIKVFGLYGLFVKQGFGWPWFDLFIVVSALMEMVVDALYMTGTAETMGIAGFSQLRMGRVVKVTRLVRTFRIQRIIRIVAPLRTLIYSVMVTLNSLLWAMTLLFLIIYVVGVAIVQTVTDFRFEGGADEDTVDSVEHFWATLGAAMITLFQSISGGVSWREPSLALDEVSSLMNFIFMIFICFVYFAVLNVVTAVFCTSAIETTQRNPEVIASAMITNKNTYEANLRRLFKNVDVDGSGLITLKELERILADELMHAHLMALEIDVDDAWTLFRLVDSDKSGVIELQEFIEGCRKLKGTAKALDIASLRTEVKGLSKTLVRFMKATEEQFELYSGKPCSMPRGSTFANAEKSIGLATLAGLARASDDQRH